MPVAGRGSTPLSPRNRIPLPPAALGIGVALSILVSALFRDAIASNANLRFQREASDARHLIERRILSYIEIIHGLRALFATRETVDRDEFHRYVSALDLPRNFPGFELLNYAAHVPAANRRGFEEAVRRDTSLQPRGYPDFAIRPGGERESYLVLVYLEPMEGNEAAFGLDVSANARVAQAIAAARDTGELTASGRLILTKGDPGLAMRMAVYKTGMPLATVEQRRAAYVGSVGAGFNVRRLMRGALSESSPDYLRFRLHDAGPAGGRPASTGPTGDSLLFDSDNLAGVASGHSDAKEDFVAVLPMGVGGRVWELHFRARRDAVIGKFDLLLPWLVLLGGGASSLLLYEMFRSVVSSRSRALAMAAEVRQRTAELEDAVSELESFSYSVSHDLRAPLRHMSGFAGLLRERWRELDTATAARYLTNISEGATKMGALIDDLLAFSRTGRAPLKLRRVDLGPLVEEVRRECVGDAGERSIEWKVGPLPAVEADPALLRIALVNLIGNAVKFTGERERAVIEIGAQKQAPAEAVVYIRDNGVGFEMRYAEKLFGVFQRLHGEGEFPGTGVGLAMVRRIVQRHGGRIWAEAVPHEGATFYLTLRTAPEANGA
jgi:signal transduction histidine kinase